MKKILGLVAALIVIVCVVRVALMPAPTQSGTKVPDIALDRDGAVQRLAGALRIPTVSYEEREKNDPAQLVTLAGHLQRSFPRVHEKLKRELVGNSLLYTWTGTNPSAKPVILCAHMDVVPVAPGTEKDWQHAPFGGEVANGEIWGRGARDDKSSVLALLEAVELSLAAGAAPQRTIYLAFGEDEEIGGLAGARNVAALLKSRGVMAEFLLDEGGAVLDGLVAGVRRPVAAIMASEKGYYTVQLEARGEGGHSSMPRGQTAVGELARAVARVQDAPFPTHLVHPVTDMLDKVGPEMPLGARFAIANRWLLGGLLERKFASAPSTNALVRTTTAPTVFQAGVKDNVLPTEARALINFRILPGDTTAAVLAHVREAVADPGIEITPYGGFASEPSTPSPTDNAAYQLLAKTTREIFPEAVISTGLVSGATDARNYEGVFESRYNFSPATLRAEDLHTIHGIDERIGVDDYLGMVRWYAQLFRNL